MGLKKSQLSHLQAVLDHLRVSTALNKIGDKLKSLAFLPKANLHNIVEFQNVMVR